MANQAEVDLIVNTAGALPDLERQLTSIVRTAENNTEPVDVQTRVNTVQSLRQLDAQLSAVVDQVQGRIDPVEVTALLQQREAVRTLSRQVDQVINTTTRTIDPVTIQGVLDSPETLATVRSQLEAVIARVQATDPEIEIDVDIDQDRLDVLQRSLTQLGRGARSTAGALGPLALRIGAVGTALGGLLNLLPAAAAAVAEVGPAAAVATQGMLAARLAAGTFQIAMVGVEEAIEAAFDPDAKPEDLEKALKRLAPEARKTVLALRGMKDELREIQQGVQNRFFRDFGDTLKGLSRTTGPAVTKALNTTADSLNRMAQGAATAAGALGTDGTLGKALSGATKGLQNLEFVPARITTALGQLAAASAPAFDRLTKRVDQAVADITTRLAVAFRTGDLTKDIDEAFSTLGQLARSVGNVLGGLRNIVRGLTDDGRELFDVLEDLTAAFEGLTASSEFQLILSELAKTADRLVANILPLIKKAFEELAPVIAELGPPIRDFIDQVGPELIPLLEDLGPVLVDIAKILKEQLPVAILFAKAAIDVLRVTFQGLHFVLNNIILPIVRTVARVFQSELFTQIASVSRQIAGKIQELASTFERFRDRVAGVFRSVVEAGNRFVTQLREGLINGAVRTATGFVAAFARLPGEVISIFRSLPGILFGIGQNIIQGLINGISSRLGGVLSIARSIANQVKNTISSALDINSPSRVTFAQGAFTGEGFALGLESMLPRINRAVAGLTNAVAGPMSGNGLALAGPGAPQVNVFVGGERLDARIDYRVNRGFRTRDLATAQGVRRLG